MRLLVRASARHKGMLLEVEPDRETITLVGPEGQTLGGTTWESLIDHILATSPPPPAVPVRQHARAPISIEVRYRTADGSLVESRTAGIGGGGLFIESSSSLAPGSPLVVEFALPDRPNEWVQVTGRVAWICERPDQYHFHPGMGIRFEEIAEEVRERIIALVNTLLHGQEG